VSVGFGSGAAVAVTIGMAIERCGAVMLNFLVPAYCRHCDSRVVGGAWAPVLCEACGRGFPVHDAAVSVPGMIERAWAFALFEGAARRLLIDLK